jgi:predicted N-acetyltransferase YhbS
MSDAAASIHAHQREAYGEVATPFWRSLPEHARREVCAVFEEVAHGPCTITAEVDGEVVGLVEVSELAVALNDRVVPGGVRRLISPTVIVRPEHRRAGIGDTLMRACAAMVRADGHILVAQVLDFRRTPPSMARSFSATASSGTSTSPTTSPSTSAVMVHGPSAASSSTAPASRRTCSGKRRQNGIATST